MKPMLTGAEAFAALGILEYAMDLFTATPKTNFSRQDVLVVLSLIRDDPELIDPSAVIEFQEAQ